MKTKASCQQQDGRLLAAYHHLNKPASVLELTSQKHPSVDESNDPGSTK